MKKISIIFYFILILIAVPMSIYGQQKLVIWSFTDEVKNLNDYYKITHPGVEVEYTQYPSDRFQTYLDLVLATGQGAPDIIALESAFVRKYVESGLLLDITDIYNANKSKLLTYPVEIGTYNGKVYAMSWQASPGAMFYRRSLAKKYLGTDDPKVVQTYFSDFNKFLETAKLLKDKSNDSCVVISALGDLRYPFLYTRKNPWIVNGKRVVDPAMEQYLDIGKVLHDNHLEGGVTQWSEKWFEGMRGKIRDAQGKYVDVFSYFLPTWGLHYVLKTNAPSTSGDWAIIQGPSSYRWGGTWIGAYRGTKNVAAVKEYIRFITTDDALLEAWAKDTGDLVSNVNVINKIKNSYKEPYLGGQNHYAEFAEMAKGINGKLDQASDEAIEAIFDEAAAAYWSGEKTKDKAMTDSGFQSITGKKFEETVKIEPQSPNKKVEESTQVEVKSVKVQGANLTAKLVWVLRNAQSNGDYTIELDKDESLSAQTLVFEGKTNVTLRFTGGETERVINSSFEITSGVTFVLGKGVTLRGCVQVKEGASLIMDEGSKITVNSDSSVIIVSVVGTFKMNGGEISGNYLKWGACMSVDEKGTFTMNGGSISGNSSYNTRYSTGDRCYIVSVSGTFNMNGGEISNNKDRGVTVHKKGIFIMNGGEISKNRGNGVSVAGTFIMNGGTISGNTGSGVYNNGTFTMSGGTISGNIYPWEGGGVYVAGTFTMSGGEISFNTAGQGGGVYNKGTFTMSGGVIFGNTAIENNEYTVGGPFIESGGGVYGSLTKKGGTIYGYTEGDSKSNVVKKKSGVVQTNKGHAVYIDSARFRDSTILPDDNPDPSKTGLAGGWGY